MNILIINGPNLNLLGTREPSIYGNKTWEEIFFDLKTEFSKIDYFQSNYEGELIEAIQKASLKYQALILNLGAYTHTSVALRDAVAACNLPKIEVHLSKPTSREYFRHKSLISDYCIGVVSGFGVYSYKLALSYFEKLK